MERIDIRFLGAVEGVTGSCYLIEVGQRRILLEYGQIQGSRKDEERNRDELPIHPREIDAVVLSHAHIDHSGRLPLLARQGFSGPIYTHHATRALCEIMLRDSAYLHEKDAEWENKKRQRKGLRLITPLYTREDAEAVMNRFVGIEYGARERIYPELEIRLSDAGHILGAAIVELWLSSNGVERKLVFSGDLGYHDAPVMEDPTEIAYADLVLLESTYGDRQHQSFDETLKELNRVFDQAKHDRGNVVIPAFAVGRTQDLLYLMAEHYDDWGIGDWRVYLDSPMAIQSTEVYARYRRLYGARLFKQDGSQPTLKNLRMTRTSAESMALNQIDSGAIIIAGSGMCTGGRIRHHLKHNVWRSNCHVVIVGFQARGTTGRMLVDGAPRIRLWQEAIKVNAKIHTVGGLSAHADQNGLVRWYGAFQRRPPVYLVHGEPKAQRGLAQRLQKDFGAEVRIPKLATRLDLLRVKKSV